MLEVSIEFFKFLNSALKFVGPAFQIRAFLWIQQERWSFLRT